MQIAQYVSAFIMGWITMLLFKRLNYRVGEMIFGRHRVTRTLTELEEPELLQLIGDYVRHIEVSKTSDVCSCVTRVLPIDENLPKGAPRRMQLIEAALHCPVHTREGFLIGFTKYIEAYRNDKGK